MADVTRNMLFSMIENRDEAVKLVKDAAVAFFLITVLAVAFSIMTLLQVGASFFLGYNLLYEAVIYASGGYALFRYRSRSAALILLAATGFGLYLSILHHLADRPGRNVILSGLLLVAAARAVEATFKLRGRFAE